MWDDSIGFLDVHVNIDKWGQISTDLFTKPTDSNAYLHFQSDHPQHLKKAIPHGLGGRLKRICSKEGDYRRHRKRLKSKLIERYYPERPVEADLAKVDSKKAENRVQSQ